MEPSRKRPSSVMEEEPCCICTIQKKYGRNKKYKVIPTFKVQGIASVKDQYHKGLNKAEWPDNIAPAFTYLAKTFSDSDTPCLRWHSDSCRPNFMSPVILDRYPDKETPMADTETVETFELESSYSQEPQHY